MLWKQQWKGSTSPYSHPFFVTNCFQWKKTPSLELWAVRRLFGQIVPMLHHAHIQQCFLTARWSLVWSRPFDRRPLTPAARTFISLGARPAILPPGVAFVALTPVAAHSVDADLWAQCPIAGGTLIDVWRWVRTESVLKPEFSHLG